MLLVGFRDLKTGEEFALFLEAPGPERMFMAQVLGEIKDDRRSLLKPEEIGRLLGKAEADSVGKRFDAAFPQEEEEMDPAVN